MKIPKTNIQRALFLLLHIHVGGAMLFNHLKSNELPWIGTHVSMFLIMVFVVFAILFIVFLVHITCILVSSVILLTLGFFDLWYRSWIVFSSCVSAGLRE